MNAKAQKIEKVRAMCEAVKAYAADEYLNSVEHIGGLRPAEILIDTYAGLPLPQKGDWIFYGTAFGIRRKFLLRDTRIIYSTPIN